MNAFRTASTSSRHETHEPGLDPRHPSALVTASESPQGRSRRRRSGRRRPSCCVKEQENPRSGEGERTGSGDRTRRRPAAGLGDDEKGGRYRPSPMVAGEEEGGSESTTVRIHLGYSLPRSSKSSSITAHKYRMEFGPTIRPTTSTAHLDER